MRTLLVFLFSFPLLFAQQSSRPKLAVVGLVHSHAWGHLENLAKGTTAAELAGVAEPNKDLQAEAQKAGVAPNLIYSDYREMLEKVKPSIVWAFVENNRHLEIVEYCAPRNINVMFEKPLAASHKEAVEIQALAAKHGIQILTNYQMAWWPSQYTAYEEARKSTFGPIYRIHGIVGHGGPSSTGIRNKIFFDWLTDPVKNGGGALMDFGCYNALWSLWYLGRPTSVYATTLRVQPQRFPKVEDNATIVLEYPNAVAILEGSWDLPKSYQQLEVFGRQKMSVLMKKDGSEVRRDDKTEALDVKPLPASAADPIAYMVDVVQNKKKVTGLTAVEINVDVIEIIDAAKESIKSGRPVKLKPRS
jgi:predicted dehydrogenase